MVFWGVLGLLLDSQGNLQNTANGMLSSSGGLESRRIFLCLQKRHFWASTHHTGEYVIPVSYAVIIREGI